VITFERFKRTDEFNDWLKRLDGSIRVVLTKKLAKYEEDGKLPKTAGILKNTDGVGEMRFDFGPGYRIYFCQCGKIIILLLNGGDKDTQSTDLGTAKSIKNRELRKIQDLGDNNGNKRL